MTTRQIRRSAWMLLVWAAGPIAAETPESIWRRASSADPSSFSYTHVRADGNRVVAGRGTFPSVRVVDIPLDGTPSWVVAAVHQGLPLWVVVSDNGDIQAFLMTDGGAKRVTAAPERIPAGMPPLLLADGPAAVLPPLPAIGRTADHPIPIARQGAMAVITPAGALVFWIAGRIDTLAVGALPDSRLVADSRGRLLVLTGPSDRYAHGILGDRLEATQITLVSYVPVPRVVRVLTLPGEKVIEGLLPIWADLDSDGTREIVVTASDAATGAQIMVFDENGEIRATGAPIGRGYRWLHQIAVDAFGPSGEIELATVRTPHIGGVVEFYRLSGGKMIKVASAAGYSSHIIGSRNLDMALAGDFDGDGRPELVVPEQSFTAIAGLSRMDGGFVESWNLPLDGRLSSNIAAVVSADGALQLGAGVADGILRVWLSTDR